MMLTALLLASVVLRGETMCPSTQDVSKHLGGLDADRAGTLRVVELREDSDVVRLALWNPDGSIEAVRELPRTESCDALARAAAVTIAMWDSKPLAPHVDPPEPRRTSYRVFPAASLEETRVRLLQAPPEEERVTHLRGPLALMGAGTLIQAGAVGIAATLFGQPSSSGTLAGLFVFGGGSALLFAGLLWFIGALGATPHDGIVRF